MITMKSSGSHQPQAPPSSSQQQQHAAFDACESLNFSDLGSLADIFEDDKDFSATSDTQGGLAAAAGESTLAPVQEMPPVVTSSSTAAAAAVPTSSSNNKMKKDVASVGGVAAAAKAKGILQPNVNDVLLGRGGRNNQWTGNEQLRTMAREMSDAYAAAPKRNKPAIAWILVTKVRALLPMGRFLKQEQGLGEWHEVDDEVAREKASQCLRDIVAANTKRSKSQGNLMDSKPSTGNIGSSSMVSLSTSNSLMSGGGMSNTMMKNAQFPAMQVTSGNVHHSGLSNAAQAGLAMLRGSSGSMNVNSIGSDNPTQLSNAIRNAGFPIGNSMLNGVSSSGGGGSMNSMQPNHVSMHQSMGDVAMANAMPSTGNLTSSSMANARMQLSSGSNMQGLASRSNASFARGNSGNISFGMASPSGASGGTGNATFANLASSSSSAAANAGLAMLQRMNVGGGVGVQSNQQSQQTTDDIDRKRRFASAPNLGDMSTFMAKRRRPTATHQGNATFGVNFDEPLDGVDYQEPAVVSQQQRIPQRQMAPKSMSCMTLGKKSASAITLGSRTLHQGSSSRRDGGYQDPLLARLQSLKQQNDSHGGTTNSMENSEWVEQTEQQTPSSQEPKPHNCFSGLGAALGEDDDAALRRWIDRMAEEELS